MIVTHRYGIEDGCCNGMFRIYDEGIVVVDESAASIAHGTHTVQNEEYRLKFSDTNIFLEYCPLCGKRVILEAGVTNETRN